MNSKTKLTLFTIAQALITSFYMFESVWQYSSYITWGPLNTFRTIGFFILLGLIITDFVYKPISKKTLIKISLTFLIITIVSVTSKKYYLLFALLAILAIRDLNIDKVITRDAIVRCGLLALEIIMFILKAGDSHWQVSRLTMGFDHANTFGCELMIVGIEFLYLTRKSKNPLSLIVCLFFVVANYVIARSRSSMIILSLAIIFFLIFKFKISILKNKPIQIFIRNSFLILTLVSFGLFFLYRLGNPLAIKLDSLFSSRIFLASHYLDVYGVNLFGNEILKSGLAGAYIGDNWYYVLDMSFINFVLSYGIIGWLVFAYLFNITFKSLFNEKKHGLVLVLLLVLIYGMMENYAFIIGHNIFLIVLVYGIFNKQEEYDYYPSKQLVLTLSIIFISIFIFRETIVENASQFFLSENTDSYNQVKFLLAYYQRIHDLNFSSYDWSLGLGSSVYNLYLNNFLSPFNLLVLLLKKDWIPSCVLYLNIFKLVTLGIGSSLWLSKLSKNRNNIIMISLMIAFSSLLLNKYATAYFDFFCIVPFVLYYIEKAISENKYIGLIISIFLLLLTYPALWIQSMILLSIYAVYRIIDTKDSKLALTIIKTLAVIILSAGLTSFICLPCLQYVTGETSDSIFALFVSLFTASKTISDTSISLYTSVGALMMLPYIFTSNAKKQVLAGIFTVLFIVLSLIFKSNTFVYYLLLLFISSIILFNIDNYNEEKNKYIFIGYAISLAIMFITYVVYRVNNEALGYKEFYIELALPILITFVLIAFKKEGVKAISFSIVFEACISMYCLTAVNSATKQTLSIDSDVSNIIKETDSSFYRVINGDGSNSHIDQTSDYYSLNYNYSDLAREIAGVSTNDNAYNSEQEEYINLINTSDDSLYYGYDKNYISLYNIAGAKYWISSEENFDLVPPSYFEDMDTSSVEKNILEFKINKANSGWTNTKYNGETAGTSKDEMQIETLTISLNNQPYSGNIIYTSYIKGSGWQNDVKDQSTWKMNGEESGTTDQGLALTGICINLTDQMSKNYDIYYRVNGNETGWSSWVKNGEKVGVYEDDYLDAIQIEIREKGELAPNQKYYKNKYYVELGYVNNNLINADYASSLSSIEKEKLLRTYVATNSTDNTNYSIEDSFTYISDYLYDNPATFDFEEPISNTTLIVVNGGIPIVNVDLYSNGELVRTENFYQYDYCNIEISSSEQIDSVTITYNDIDETGFAIRLASMDLVDKTEEKLYNLRSQNSFTNVIFDDDDISGDINVSLNNSFVYTYVTYDENWKVYDNGNEIETIKANYGFIGFYLDEGEHHIEFKYENNNIVGNIISIVSLMLLFVFVIVNKFKK